MKRIFHILGQVLFWSVISAAFVGPGTVTTAAKAGASYGSALAWALAFSIGATILLQEAVARIPHATGKRFGEALTHRMGEGTSAMRIRYGLALMVVFGCAAYQAGNILGALSGLRLLLPGASQGWIGLMAALAAALLWSGNIQRIARLLGLVVAAMGIGFLIVALQVDEGEVPISASLFPEGSEMLVVALIGTTIVPYNLFLGSGLGKGQSLSNMRWGIVGAVLLGGIVSFAIMRVGSAMEGTFSFQALSDLLAQKLGTSFSPLLGFGLLAAGFTSAVTAPLAASMAMAEMVGRGKPEWSPSGKYFRLVWSIVLGIGLLFGLLDVQPIPAIILAQAINGILLPAVAAFVIFAVNDPQIMPERFRNARWLNGFSICVLGITLFLGLLNLTKAFFRLIQATPPDGDKLLAILGGVAALLTFALVRWGIRKLRTT